MGLPHRNTVIDRKLSAGSLITPTLRDQKRQLPQRIAFKLLGLTAVLGLAALASESANTAPTNTTVSQPPASKVQLQTAGQSPSISQSSASSGSPNPQVHVSVNGREISVPTNDSRVETITTPDQTTVVNASGSSSSDGNSYSSNITTTSQSSVNTNAMTSLSTEVHN